MEIPTQILQVETPWGAPPGVLLVVVGALSLEVKLEAHLTKLEEPPQVGRVEVQLIAQLQEQVQRIVDILLKEAPQQVPKEVHRMVQV